MSFNEKPPTKIGGFSVENLYSKFLEFLKPFYKKVLSGFQGRALIQ